MLSEREIKRSLNGIFILLLSFFNSSLYSGELLTRMERELSDLIDIAKPSVVSITSTVAYKVNSTEESSLFPFFGKKTTESQTFKFRNVSSGLVLDQKGHIVTKSSVVKDAEIIEVTLYNHETHPAHFIGFDDKTGLAVIKIDNVNLTPAKLGNNRDIRIGRWVAILGNSVGVTTSVSLGIINGIREENNLIQLSALINPGNSGSPIFNTDGEVLGVVAARINSGSLTFGSTSAFQSFEGGVAYPVEIIQKVSDNLIHNKGRKRPWLGISTQDVPGEEIAVVITRVIENSPAQKAGFLPNDVVLAVSDKKVRTSLDLLHYLKNTTPDSNLVFSIKRGDQILNLEIVPENWPANYPSVAINPNFDYYLNSISFQDNQFVQNEAIFGEELLEELRMKIIKLEEEIARLKNQVQK